MAYWVRELTYQWDSIPDYKFGYIVVILAGWLAFERWSDRPRVDSPPPGWHSLGLALLGFPLVAIAELYRHGVARVPWIALVLSVGCGLFVLANILAIRGWATLRHFFFPLLFFFVAVPLPHILWDPIVFGLRKMVTIVNVEILKIMGIPATMQGHLIHLPRGTVSVDAACSGIRSLQSSIMAALFIGDLTLRRPVWKIVFLAVGISLATFGNFARSLYLTLTAHWKGMKALDQVHDSAGWSVLAFTAVGVGAFALWIERMEKKKAKMSTTS